MTPDTGKREDRGEKGDQEFRPEGPALRKMGHGGVSA